MLHKVGQLKNLMKPIGGFTAATPIEVRMMLGDRLGTLYLTVLSNYRYEGQLRSFSRISSQCSG